MRPPHEVISLLGNTCDSIVKTIKPLHNMLEASLNQFTTYYLQYKDKFNNQTQSFVFVADNYKTITLVKLYLSNGEGDAQRE